MRRKTEEENRNSHGNNGPLKWTKLFEVMEAMERAQNGIYRKNYYYVVFTYVVFVLYSEKKEDFVGKWCRPKSFHFIMVAILHWHEKQFWYNSSHQKKILLTYLFGEKKEKLPSKRYIFNIKLDSFTRDTYCCAQFNFIKHFS